MMGFDDSEPIQSSAKLTGGGWMGGCCILHTGPPALGSTLAIAVGEDSCFCPLFVWLCDTGCWSRWTFCGLIQHMGWSLQIINEAINISHNTVGS